MNILILNHYAGAPSMGMEYRHYYLAREWEKKGHNVLIVCASYTHLRSRQFTLQENYKKFNIDGIDYLVLKTSEYKENDFKRIFNILSFVARLFKLKRYIAEDFIPDVVISSSTYLFEVYSAKKISKLAGAKLIVEVKDLWPLAIVELDGFSRTHPYIMSMQIAEKYAYRNCDKIVCLLPKAKNYMTKHGLDPVKFNYLPNGIYVEEWDINKEISGEISDLIYNIKTQGKKIICYAGNHGIANSLYSLIDAMKILEQENVVLLLIGNGQEKERLIQYANDLKLKNIHFQSAIPKTFIPPLLKEMDILYIGLKNQPVFRFGISPNKLMDYMMSGKPIIQAIDAGNDIVTEAECGITIEPENPQAIAKTVKFLLSRTDEELELMGKNGREYCIRNHDYKVLADNFLNIMSNPDIN